MNKEDFITAIIKSHWILSNNKSDQNKELLKILSIVFAVMFFLIAILLFFASNKIGETITQISYSILIFSIIFIVNIIHDLKDKLLTEEKDKEILKTYQNKIELFKSFSKIGAYGPDEQLFLKTRNFLLSDEIKEFQSLLILLDNYMPSHLSSETIKKFEDAGIHVIDDINLLGDKQGYRVRYT